jgi:hypothetical protein
LGSEFDAIVDFSPRFGSHVVEDIKIAPDGFESNLMGDDEADALTDALDDFWGIAVIPDDECARSAQVLVDVAGLIKRSGSGGLDPKNVLDDLRVRVIS